MSLLAGIHYGINMADYLSDPCPAPSLSASLVNDIIFRSPLHALTNHPRLGTPVADGSRAADIGTVAHALTFGGGGDVVVVQADDWRKAEAKAAREAATTAGKLAILAKHNDIAVAMATAAHDYLSSAGISVIGGRPEPTMIWQDAHTWFRARPDWLADDYSLLIHYKTTEASARPQDFARGILTRSGYDNTMAFYRLGAMRLFGRDDTAHLMLVQEQAAPYACSLIRLSEMLMAVASDRVLRAIGQWRRCVESECWHGYDTTPFVAEATAWQLAENEREMQKEDDK